MSLPGQTGYFFLDIKYIWENNALMKYIIILMMILPATLYAGTSEVDGVILWSIRGALFLFFIGVFCHFGVLMSGRDYVRGEDYIISPAKSALYIVLIACVVGLLAAGDYRIREGGEPLYYSGNVIEAKGNTHAETSFYRFFIFTVVCMSIGRIKPVLDELINANTGNNTLKP